MTSPEITAGEIQHLLLLSYALGILSVVLILQSARLLAGWRADRRRAAQFRIHRRTPFGI